MSFLKNIIGFGKNLFGGSSNNSAAEFKVPERSEELERLLSGEGLAYETPTFKDPTSKTSKIPNSLNSTPATVPGLVNFLNVASPTTDSNNAQNDIKSVPSGEIHLMNSPNAAPKKYLPSSGFQAFLSQPSPVVALPSSYSFSSKSFSSPLSHSPAFTF